MMKRVLSFVLAVVMVAGLAFMAPVHTHATTEMTASEECARYLKSMEGFLAVPVWDIAQWTVGFGTRCPDEDLERYKKEGIPMEEAHALFAKYLSLFAGAVNKFLDRKGITVTQNQFDALVCLSYNKGDAWMYRDDDAMVQAVVNGDMGNDLIAAMTLSVVAGGNYLPGLLRRRLTEANMYINGIYDLHEPENYCHVLYDGNGGTKSRSAQGYDCYLPAEPVGTATRDGYTFTGWYTAPQGGTKVTELTADTDGMTLYAHWSDGSGTEEEPGEGEEAVLVRITTEVLNIRSGPGRGYGLVGSLTEGTVVGVTEVQKDELDELWGKISQGWICLTYTNYQDVIDQPEKPEEPDEPAKPEKPTEPEVPEVPVSPLPEGLPLVGTVIGTDSIIVYNGPHNTYPQLGTIAEGEKVTITETYELFGIIWGKCELGWVRTDRNILFTGYKMLAHPFTATVTNSYVYVRSGPSTEFGRLVTLYKNAPLHIEAILVREGYTWGMTQEGWIALDYTDFDSEKLSYYENHTYEDWRTTKKATCSEVGQERRDCTECDHYQTRKTEKTAHDYGKWQDTKAATCVEPGQQKRTCKECGYEQTRNTELGSHSCGQWYTVTEATCTVEGEQRRDCKHCDYFETQKLPLAEHAYGSWYETQEATDTVPGQERRDCKVCDHYEVREIPVTEHVFGDWYETKAPTCTEKGEARKDCTHCSYYEIRELAPKGHRLGDWKVHKAATCTAEGEERRSCANCEHYESRKLDKTEHTLGKWMVYKAATCTAEGEERRTCTGCDHYESRKLEKTAHTLGEWKVYKAATCTAEGEERRSCTGCDHYESRKLSKTEHTYGQWKVTREATCTERGEQRRTCTGCDAYESKDIAAKGHSYGDWIVVKAPTYTEKGQEKRVCDRCDHVENRETPCRPAPVEKTYGTLTGYSFLRIREGLGFGYKVVGQLSYGDRVEILEQQEYNKQTWGRIDRGWICLTGYMTLETVLEDVETGKPVDPENPEVPEKPGDTGETTEKTYAIILVSALRIRENAGINYEEVGYYTKGERVEILEKKEAGGATWGRTDKGWICLTDYTKLETVQVEKPAEPENPDTPEESEKPSTPVTRTYGTLTGYDFLRIREGLGTNYPQVGTLYYGDRVEILEQKQLGSYTWGRIDKGWICLTGYMTLTTVTEQPEEDTPALPEKPSDPTNPSDEPEVRTFAVIIASQLNIRQGAGTNFARVGFYTYGQRVEVFEQKEAGGATWGRTDEGWICLSQYTRLETETQVEDEEKVNSMTVIAELLNVRNGAGLNFDVVGTLKKGTVVIILDEKKVGNMTWVRIAEGWVCKDYLV